MDKKVLISVILPVFNAQEYIEETIRSVENSTFKDYELLLIDDGSWDKSSEICKKCVEKNEKIKYIYKENGGVASARNLGLEVATGEYIAFLDADDSFSENMLEKMYYTAKKHNADVCVAGWNECRGKVKEATKIVLEDVLVENEKGARELALMLLTSGYIQSSYEKITPGLTMGVVWNSIFRRQFLKDNQIHFFCFWNNEDDWIFDIRCYKKAQRIYLMEESLYNYRIDEASLSHKKRYIKNLYRKRRKGINWIWKNIDDLCQGEVEKEKKAELYKGLLQRRLLLYTFYNETAVKRRMSPPKAIAYIKKAVKKEQKLGIKKTLYYEAGKIEGFYIWLLLHHGVGLCYFLNRYLVKKYR